MSDSVINYLDSYCERAGDVGAFAEPLNLYTNLFFIVAAVLSGMALKRARIAAPHQDLWLMVVFMYCIGIGSSLWHFTPDKATVLMDVIPITLFINAYIVSALRRLFALPWSKVFLWWFVYFAAGIAAQRFLPPDVLNGTIMYIPTYFALVVMTVKLRVRLPEIGRVFTLALLVWTLSLTLRTVDSAVCPSLAIGTHFLWHTLNAWVLWRLLAVLIQHASRPVTHS